ncbi:MAG: type VI secretion system ATPase TssH, partial [Polyangiaceae bacterium]|nr:type VI secretion system ATPase TssH [Polyangiaceae bacterium]
MRRMLLVEPKSIIKRLSRSCTNALEAAVAQCVNARHYEVTVEHIMLALLDDADSDIAFLVMHYDLDPSQLRAVLQRSLEDLRTGNSGRPVLSPNMLEWMQDAWLTGSVEYGYQKVRSGVLFARLVQQAQRYSMSNIGSYLERIPKDDIKANLAKIISGSKEEGEAVQAAAGGAAGGKLPAG